MLISLSLSIYLSLSLFHFLSLSLSLTLTLSLFHCLCWCLFLYVYVFVSFTLCQFHYLFLSVFILSVRSEICCEDTHVLAGDVLSCSSVVGQEGVCLVLRGRSQKGKVGEMRGVQDRVCLCETK